MGNKALTAALYRPGVRRAQFDKAGQCGEEAKPGAHTSMHIPSTSRATKEPFPDLKGPLRVGRERSPLEPNSCGFCKAALVHQRSTTSLSCSDPPPCSWTDLFPLLPR